MSYPHTAHLMAFVMGCGCYERRGVLCNICREYFARALWRIAFPPIREARP